MSDTSLQEKIGYRVRRRRMALGWNQTQLAARMHMPQGHISRLELGKYAAVNPEKLVTLAQALSTTTDYLLGLSDDPGAIEAMRGDGEDEARHGKPSAPVGSEPDVSAPDVTPPVPPPRKTAKPTRATARRRPARD